MNLKQAQFGKSERIVLTGPRPEGTDGHIKAISKPDVSQSVNICTHHANSLPSLARAPRGIPDVRLPTGKLDIHEIG